MRTLLPFLLLLTALQLQAFESKSAEADSSWKTLTAVYLEFGGKFLPSLNVDFRTRENLAIAVGAAYWYDAEGGGPQSLFLPSVSAYYLGGRKHQVELGGGLGPFIGSRVGVSSVMLFANVGYRYQRKGGLIIRAGFTPWVTAVPIDPDARVLARPWAGVSVGYTF